MTETAAYGPSTRRLVSRPFLAALAFGDALVVVAFIGYGLTSHAIEPWEYPIHTVRTALPFVIGWLVVAPLLGAYARRTVASYRRTVAISIPAWALAAIVGGAIRSTDRFPGGAPPEFLLVIAGFGLGFLLPWRLLVTAVRRRIGVA